MFTILQPVQLTADDTMYLKPWVNRKGKHFLTVFLNRRKVCSLSRVTCMNKGLYNSLHDAYKHYSSSIDTLNLLNLLHAYAQTASSQEQKEHACA